MTVNWRGLLLLFNAASGFFGAWHFNKLVDAWQFDFMFLVRLEITVLLLTIACTFLINHLYWVRVRMKATSAYFAEMQLHELIEKMDISPSDAAVLVEQIAPETARYIREKR